MEVMVIRTSEDICRVSLKSAACEPDHNEEEHSRQVLVIVSKNMT